MPLNPIKNIPLNQNDALHGNQTPPPPRPVPAAIAKQATVGQQALQEGSAPPQSVSIPAQISTATPVVPTPGVAQQATVAQQALHQVSSPPQPLPALLSPRIMNFLATPYQRPSMEQMFLSPRSVPVPAVVPAVAQQPTGEQPQNPQPAPVFFNSQIYPEEVKRLTEFLTFIPVCEALHAMLSMQDLADQLSEFDTAQRALLEYILTPKTSYSDQPNVLTPNILHQLGISFISSFPKKCSEALQRLLTEQKQVAAEHPLIRLVQLACLEKWMNQDKSKGLIFDILFFNNSECRVLIAKAVGLRMNFIKSIEAGKIQKVIEERKITINLDTIERDIKLLYACLIIARYLHNLTACYCAEHTCAHKKGCNTLKLFFGGLNVENISPLIKTILIATYSTDDLEKIRQIRIEARAIGQLQQGGDPFLGKRTRDHQ